MLRRGHNKFQLALSLSCRRLRVLLSFSLDLSLYDISTKLRFLQCLEPDYPEYLTCHSQLILANYWEVDLKSRQNITHKARLLESALCLHFEVNIWREKIWQTMEQAVASMIGLEKPKVFKCSFCENDYKLHMQNSMSGRMRICQPDRK